VILVLDSNVVVSGLLWSGPPRTLLALAAAPGNAALTSPQLLAELERVLGRSHLRERAARLGWTPADLVAAFARATRVLEAPPIPPTCRDRDDDMVLAVAAAGGAELVVTGDADLLVLGEACGARIVTVAEAIRRLGGG